MYEDKLREETPTTDVIVDTDGARLDVVFVHGITKRWQKTWGGSDKQKNGIRYVARQSRECRVTAYGLNVLQGLENESEIIHRASDGLVELLRKSKQSHRSTVLVSHSLGGMVVKDALNKTMNDASVTVEGALFLGTPSCTEEKNWMEFSRKLRKALLRPKEILRDHFSPMSEINRRFNDWCMLRRNSVWCFFETLPVYRVGLIVPTDMAVIHGCKHAAFQQDHLHLARLENVFDPRYDMILKAIRAISNPETPTTNLSRSRASTLTEVEAPDTMAQIRKSMLSDGRQVLDDRWGELDGDFKKAINHALFLDDSGRYAEAATHFHDLATGCERLGFGPTHPITLFCLDKEAVMSMYECKYEKAKSIAQGAWRTRKELLNNPEQGTDLQQYSELALLSAASLARIFRYTADYIDAVHILQEALALTSQCPLETPAGTVAVSILAKILKDLGLLEVSELLTRDVVKACKVHFDSSHPFTLNRRSDLGVVFSKQKRFEAAETVTREALQGLESALGSTHPHTLRASKRLGSYLRFQGKTSEACIILKETLAHQKLHFGPKHPDVLSTQCSLAAAYALGWNPKEARTLLREAIDLRKTLLAPEHQDVVMTQRMLDNACEMEAYLSKHEVVTPAAKENFEKIFKEPTKPTSELERKALEAFRSPQHELQSIFPDDEMTIRKIESTLESGQKLKDTRATNKLFRTILARGDSSQVEQLLQLLHPDFNLAGGFYGSSLHAAAFSGNVFLVQRVLDQPDVKARIDEQKGIYGSALRIAAIYGYKDVMECLLEAEANSNIANDFFGTALQAAIISRRTDIIRLLLKNLVSKGHPRNAPIRQYIQEAAIERNLSVIQLLLKVGQPVGVTFAQYMHAEESSTVRDTLEAALRAGSTEAIKVFLDDKVTTWTDPLTEEIFDASVNGRLDILDVLLDPVIFSRRADTGSYDLPEPPVEDINGLNPLPGYQQVHTGGEANAPDPKKARENINAGGTVAQKSTALFDI